MNHLKHARRRLLKSLVFGVILVVVTFGLNSVALV
jgi:hypothetical protein